MSYFAVFGLPAFLAGFLAAGFFAAVFLTGFFAAGIVSS